MSRVMSTAGAKPSVTGCIIIMCGYKYMSVATTKISSFDLLFRVTSPCSLVSSAAMVLDALRR